MTFRLEPLCDDLRRAATEVSGVDVDPELVSARLADGLRDAGVPAPVPAAWRARTQSLKKEDWERLDVLTRVLRESASGAQVSECVAADPARTERAFVEFATGAAKLLTVELLLKSMFRVEELARKWVDALGGSFEGETEAQSRELRERLDFGGVLDNLKAADRDRDERMKKLKELEAKRLKEQQEAYARAGRE